MRALVVDHEQARRARTRAIGASLGFDVVEAVDGEQALERLAEQDGCVDLVLVEWNMPTMDGLSLVKRVREAPRYANLTILLTGSTPDPKQIAAALMLGADDYLLKPLEESALREKLTLIGVIDGSS